MYENIDGRVRSGRRVFHSQMRERDVHARPVAVDLPGLLKKLKFRLALAPSRLALAPSRLALAPVRLELAPGRSKGRCKET